MTIYNTAYKSGTFNGAPSSGATTFTVAGFTPAAGDVGRIIIVNSGNARLQHREITSVSGQDITVSHAWDTNPFIDTSSDSRATDILPASGDTCVISYDAADLIAGDADLTLTNGIHLKIAAIQTEDGAYIHFKNFHIEWNANTVKIGRGGGLILGYYGYVSNQDGYTKLSCSINEIRTSAGGISLSTVDDMGMLDIYGGDIYCASGSPFWRAYESAANSREVQVRLVNLSAFGNFGSRIDGDRSMLVNCSASESASTTGFSNPRGAVARVEISAFNCDQAGYVFLSSLGGGPSGRLVFPRIVDIQNKVIRSAGSGSHSGNNIMEVIAKKSEVDAAPTFINSDAAPASGTHTYRYGNLVRPTFVDAAGSTITDNIKNRLYDTTLAFIEEQSVTSGEYPEVFVRHTDIATVAGNLNLSDGTQYAPYSLRSVSYGKLFTTTSISAEDTFESAIVMLADSTITEATKATVDAYSTLETPEKLYDRAVSWLEGNITTETAFLVSLSGDTIDAGGYNVTIDATAGSAFAFDGSTITIKASTFTGNITTTGTFTLANGATIVGSVTDSGGTEFSTTIEVTGLTSANIYLEDNTGTQVDYQTNITGTYNYTAPLGSTGNWKLVIDRAGYIASVNTFTADGNLKSFSGVLTQLTQPSGAAMYTGSTSALLSVVPNPDGSRLNIRIGNGTVTAQQILDECEDAIATNDGMKYLSNGGGRVEFASLATGTFLFLKTNVRLIRDNIGDSSATVEAFVTSSDGVILDNTNGDVQFVTVTRAQQLIEYDHTIYVDAANGANASVYPYGTEANPVNSWSNAKVLADFYGFREIHFKGSLTLDDEAEGYIFKGGGINDVLNTSTYSVAGSTFKEMNIIGSGTGARACDTVNLLDGITNLEGTFTLCTFNEQLSVAANADVIFSRCISGLAGTAAPQINFAANSQVSIRDFDGGLTLSGSTAGCNTTADFTSGKCTIDNTNIGGVISVRGITSTAFTDNSAGATIDSAGVHEQPSEALTDYSADTKTNIKPSVSI